MSNCKYYKCHDIPDEIYDCTLCYCPFYNICSISDTYNIFGGYMLKNNILACEKCIYFHIKENVAEYTKLLNSDKTLDEIYKHFVWIEESKNLKSRNN